MENGSWVNVDGIASGGERSMAALALRVAFSMAFIPNLRWLILDEPTHNLDTNAIEHLTDALRDRIGIFVEQVFLITHDERVSEGVGGNLYRLERDKDRNEPTRTAGIENI
jgi:DNA repair exonuclease SbcCD ATPase subunit